MYLLSLPIGPPSNDLAIQNWTKTKKISECFFYFCSYLEGIVVLYR